MGSQIWPININTNPNRFIWRGAGAGAGSIITAIKTIAAIVSLEHGDAIG
ncbi:MAG: hypothetical protein FWH40_07300 [Coriobacteriia bacterium]|nr:hypothetical protein [Coriobacteriia bacterium]